MHRGEALMARFNDSAQTFFVDPDWREQRRAFHEQRAGRALSDTELEQAIHDYLNALFNDPEYRKTLIPLPKGEPTC
ncbi:hypothetical protein [Deinococcus kurensis]|uniref:hypothetical protein n=1 Tax=Deinococcus kurensis TaxID=2662757 RepID=UPI001390FC67|nr:hypothetical protein [Deinococcus kurensis]